MTFARAEAKVCVAEHEHNQCSAWSEREKNFAPPINEALGFNIAIAAVSIWGFTWECGPGQKCVPSSRSQRQWAKVMKHYQNDAGRKNRLLYNVTCPYAMYQYSSLILGEALRRCNSKCSFVELKWAACRCSSSCFDEMVSFKLATAQYIQQSKVNGNVGSIKLLKYGFLSRFFLPVVCVTRTAICEFDNNFTILFLFCWVIWRTTFRLLFDWAPGFFPNDVQWVSQAAAYCCETR